MSTYHSRWIRVGLTLGLVLLSGLAAPRLVQAAPTVSLTAPLNNSTYTAPANYSLVAEALDRGGIAKVEFYNGVTLLGTDTTSPYSWALTNVAAGSYSYTAKAFDSLNASTVSAAVTVTVTAVANPPPTVSLTAPANGASYTAPAAITLNATATDSNGIAKVEFYNGATWLGTDTTSPYSLSLTNVAAGSYSYTAKAFDSLNVSATSTAVAVTVNAPVITDTVTYYHNDALGSPIAATDAAGALLWRETYRPYGERLDNQAAAANNPVWFTGKRQDPETGLVYMGARYYNPALGRFLGIDPVEPDENNLHSLNRYEYANNNPYKFTDPDGQAAESIIDVISLGLSIKTFRQDPGFINGLAVAYDGLATAVPFLPGGIGIIRQAATKGSDVTQAVKQAADRGAAKAGEGAQKAAAKETPSISKAYQRPSGATTKAQRESVQGKPCVDCGATTARQVADHKEPLVKEYYRSGTIDKTRMRNADSVQPQCPTCSARQGAEMSRFSRQAKQENGL